ncbi:hypothetical protein D918_09539 [Trichuris suis]|nr:hypothetical protein D918_09539 [Trichuris suis]
MSVKRSSPQYSPWQLRKRKQKESQQADGLSDRFVWHDESVFLFWEVKNYWTLQKRNYFMEKERETNGMSNSFALPRRSVLAKPTIILSTNKTSISGNSVGLKTISMTPPSIRIIPGKVDGGTVSSEGASLLFSKTTAVSNTTGPPILTSVSPVRVVSSICRKPSGSSSTPGSIPLATPKAPFVMLRLADGRTVLSRAAPATNREALVSGATVTTIPTNTSMSSFLPSRLSTSVAGRPTLSSQAVTVGAAEKFYAQSSSKLSVGKLGRPIIDSNW